MAVMNSATRSAYRGCCVRGAAFSTAGITADLIDFVRNPFFALVPMDAVFKFSVAKNPGVIEHNRENPFGKTVMEKHFLDLKHTVVAAQILFTDHSDDVFARPDFFHELLDVAFVRQVGSILGDGVAFVFKGLTDFINNLLPAILGGLFPVFPSVGDKDFSLVHNWVCF